MSIALLPTFLHCFLWQQVAPVQAELPAQRRALHVRARRTRSGRVQVLEERVGWLPGAVGVVLLDRPSHARRLVQRPGAAEGLPVRVRAWVRVRHVEPGAAHNALVVDIGRQRGVDLVVVRDVVHVPGFSVNI